MLRYLVGLSACIFSTLSLAADVTVSDAQVRAFIPGASSSAAYFSLSNDTDNSLTLSGAAISGLKRVEIHQHSFIDGIMKMSQLNELTIKPNETVIFQPGGLHLMLFEPEKKLKLDQNVTLTLSFKSGKEVKANAVVVKHVNVEQHHHHH